MGRARSQRAMKGRPNLAFAAAAVLLLAVNCSNTNVITGSYATMAEARQAGALERGWIPPLVPPGASDIREAHDPNTERRWGLFSFSASDRPTLEAVLQAGETSVAGMHCGIPQRIEWWPVILRGTLNPETITAAGLKAYRTREGGFTVVVNWNQGRAYYWKH